MQGAIAHAALFTALIDLVSAYGEDAVAMLTEQIPERVRGGRLHSKSKYPIENHFGMT